MKLTTLANDNRFITYIPNLSYVHSNLSLGSESMISPEKIHSLFKVSCYVTNLVKQKSLDSRLQLINIFTEVIGASVFWNSFEYTTDISTIIGHLGKLDSINYKYDADYLINYPEHYDTIIYQLKTKLNLMFSGIADSDIVNSVINASSYNLKSSINFFVNCINYHFDNHNKENFTSDYKKFIRDEIKKFNDINNNENIKEYISIYGPIRKASDKTFISTLNTLENSHPNIVKYIKGLFKRNLINCFGV